MLDSIQPLYTYSSWANNRILDTAARLDPEQFLAESAGVGSMRDILVHTASGQWVWLERWQGTSPPALWDPAVFPDVASLRARWTEVERATAAYVASLQESDLERSVDYVNFVGERWAYPLWQQLFHQINHATQHRSEVALLLTQTGRSPGDLDFLIYLDERGDRS